MEFIDDHPVVSRRVRFKNRIEITEDQGQLVKDDMIVLWLVRARCLPPQYHPIGDSEDRYRLSVQAVLDAIPLDGTSRDQAIACLDHDGNQGYFDFNLNVPRHPDDGLVAQVANYLDAIGELRDGETPAAALARLTPPKNETPPQPSVVDDSDVVVVGSIYSNGQRPASAEFIDEAFRD